MSDQDEEEVLLVAKIRTGDAEALAKYIDRRKPQLMAYIVRQLGTALKRKLEPDDVLQELSADAVRSIPEMQLGDREPFSWLCQLAQRRIIDAHRHFYGAQKRDAAREIGIGGGAGSDSREAGFMNLLVASMTTASQAFSRNAKEARLQEALISLGPEQQEVLKLRYVDGLPSKEIAEKVGKSDAAIRVMLTRCVKKLQEMLGDEE